MRYHKPFILILLLFLCATACKKSDSLSPSDAQIATVERIYNGFNTRYRIVYNKDKTVDSIVIFHVNMGGTFDVEKFIYNGNSYTIDKMGNTLYTITTGANGMIQKIAAPGLTTDAVYTGNLITQWSQTLVTTTPPYYETSGYRYLWANNDITSANYTLSSFHELFFYDYSHAGQPGDALRIYDFLQYGSSLFKTSHVPTVVKSADSVSSPGLAAQYLYQYDNAGRISKLSVVNYPFTDTETFAYTYYQ